MAEPEPGGGLFDADVADIDAEANPLRVLKLLRHLHEPAQIQAGGVLEEDEGAIGPLAKAGIQLAHPFEHAVGVCLHLALVMDDHSSDTACEAVSEFPDRGPASLVENVDDRLRRGRMAREIAERFYDDTIFADRLSQLYRAVATRRPVPLDAEGMVTS